MCLVPRRKECKDRVQEDQNILPILQEGDDPTILLQDAQASKTKQKAIKQ